MKSLTLSLNCYCTCNSNFIDTYTLVYFSSNKAQLPSLIGIKNDGGQFQKPLRHAVGLPDSAANISKMMVGTSRSRRDMLSGVLKVRRPLRRHALAGLWRTPLLHPSCRLAHKLPELLFVHSFAFMTALRNSQYCNHVVQDYIRQRAQLSSPFAPISANPLCHIGFGVKTRRSPQSSLTILYRRGSRCQRWRLRPASTATASARHGRARSLRYHSRIECPTLL